MSLSQGARIGPYEIIALIGAGGMGEVHRARDSRLGRDVAIKVLSASVVGDADRQTRFEQEARAAAALNHPNILAVYDVGLQDGSSYIVSELLEGEPLDERLRDGALPARKAIDYAVQIARALAAAHGRDIVHRDMKPANVFITSDGRAKILDFGLAKLTGPAASQTAAIQAAALPTSPATTPGVVMGTVGYMAPEQVRGAAINHRADIFSFGVMLFEMLTGDRPFQRETTAETLTAILREDVPEMALETRRVPLGLRRIVRRCVEKDPRDRFQSALDLAFAIESTAPSSTSTTAVRESILVRRTLARRERVAWTLTGLLALLLAGVGLVTLNRQPATQQLRLLRFTIDTPKLDPRDNAVSTLAISPDGQSLGFIARDDAGQFVAWIRRFGQERAMPVKGTEGIVSQPVWSPDGRWLAFVVTGALKKVEQQGGTPVTLCTCPVMAGLSWANDLILLALQNGVIQSLPASGGTPTPVTRLGNDDRNHYRPRFLSDGRRFLYIAVKGAGSDMYMGSLDGGTSRLVRADVQGGFDVVAGHLLFRRGNWPASSPA